MKIHQLLVLLFCIVGPSQAMQPAPNPPTAILRCSDEKEIISDRIVLEQSLVLKTMLNDVATQEHDVPIIQLSTTEEIASIIVACMQILSNESAPAEKKYHAQIRKKIRDLMIVIDTSIHSKLMKQGVKQEKIMQLFLIANSLNLPLVYRAVAAIAARDNVFIENNQPLLNDDMQRKILQAKDFNGSPKEFENICSSQIEDYTRDDLIEWGIVPKCFAPEQILRGDQYLWYLAEKTDCLSLEKLSKSLKSWPVSFAEYIYTITLPFMQIKLMMNEEFVELQKMLDLLLENGLINHAWKAYALLVDYINGIQEKDDIEALFGRLPKNIDSAFKTALDIIYAKKFNANLSLPFARLINNAKFRADTSVTLMLNPGALSHGWNVMISEKLGTSRYSEISIPPVIFSEAKLKYLLPVLEPIFGKVIGFNLSEKNLSALALEICLLPNLKILVLANNNLSALAAELGFLQKIVYLDLSNNDFQSFPKAIAGFGKLKTLSIHNTSIHALSIPLGLINLKTLEVDREIAIANNPITGSQELGIHFWDAILGRWFKG